MASVKPMVSSSFCFNLSKIASSLGKTELPLDFNALVLVEISLFPVTPFILLGSSQSRTAEANPMQLAVTEILTVAVDLICQYTLRVMSLSGSETFYCYLSIFLQQQAGARNSFQIVFVLLRRGRSYLRL